MRDLALSIAFIVSTGCLFYWYIVELTGGF